MSETTKTVGTNVISNLAIAMSIPVERFNVILALAKGAINFQPSMVDEDTDRMTAEWNTHMRTVSAGLPANEAVLFGAIVALYLHEGILEQLDYMDEEKEEQELFEGEPIYPTTGKEGWQVDSFRDVV